MKNKNNLICIICIFIVTLFTMLPMYTCDYKSSHDTKFHLANIASLTETIKQNNFPGKIVPNIANNFGYGTGLFYPPLAHDSIAYINTIVDNPVISIEIFYFIALFSSGVTMFFLAKKLSDSWEIGLVSSIIYMLFPYHISNIYIRDTQGEALLFTFLPLILDGLYELYKNNNKRKFYLLFTLGYVGAMLSHLTMMVYFTVIILVLMMIKFKDTIKNIKPLIISSLFILSITSFFTVPLMEQNILGNYRVFQEGVMVEGTQDHGLNISDYLNFITTLKSNKTKYFIDFTTLALLIITLINYKKLELTNKKSYFYIIILGIISFIISTRFFPWDILPKSFRMMQYPWRFETFVSLSISLLAPLCMSLMKDKRVLSFVLSTLILLFVQPILNQASDEVINVDNIEYFYGLGWQEEYLPVKTYENKDYYENRGNDIIIKEGNGKVEIKEDVIPKLVFEISDSSTVEFPRLYYIGYTLKDSNNKKISVYENSNGFIEAKVEKGLYILDYTGTTLDKIANAVSILSILGLGVLVIWKRK